MKGDGVRRIESADLELFGGGADDVEDKGDVGRVKQLDLEQAGAEHLAGRMENGSARTETLPDQLTRDPTDLVEKEGGVRVKEDGRVRRVRERRVRDGRHQL